MNSLYCAVIGILAFAAPYAGSDFEAACHVDRLAEIENRMFIERVTGTGLDFHFTIKNPENFGLEAMEPTWGGMYLREAFDQRVENSRLILEELAEIDIHMLEEVADRVLYKTLVHYHQWNVAMADFFYFYDPFNISTGSFIQFFLIMAEFDFRRQEDISTYLTLLQTFDEVLERKISLEQERARLGLSMPDYVIDIVIELCEGFLADRDGQHFLITTFDYRLDNLNRLADYQREQYKKENERILREYLFPAYDRVIAELSLLRGSAGTEFNPMQQEYMRLFLELYAGYGFTPEYIIEMLDEEISIARGNISDLISAYPDLILALYNMALSKGSIEENVEYLKNLSLLKFPELPEHSLSLEVLHESLHFINMAAFYLIPPVDDYFSNIVRINPAVAQDDPFLMFYLAHETYGGHLLESVYKFSRGTGTYRFVNTALFFSEGFANYASGQLMRASGFDSLLVDFALYNLMLATFENARMEMGISYEGWDLEDFTYWISENDIRMNDEIIQYYFHFLSATRNTYLPYAVGWYFFNNLREMAEYKLGDAFDAREFHTLILDIGPAPLSIFAEVFEEVLGLE